MDQKLIKIKKILKLDCKGLEFLDKNDVRHSVDFQECAKNWQQYVVSSDQFDCNDIEELKDCRGVGVTSIASWPMYIEFCSYPRVRLEFSKGIFRRRAVKKYLEVKKSIYLAGWKTFDLD